MGTGNPKLERLKGLKKFFNSVLEDLQDKIKVAAAKIVSSD